MIRDIPSTGIAAGLLFLLTFVVTIFLPDAPSQSANPTAFIAVLLLLGAAFILLIWLRPKEIDATSDIGCILALGFLVWEVAFGKLSLLDPLLFPGPARVFAVFAEDYPVMLVGIVRSLTLLGAGYALALVTAIPLGLLIGWRKRLYNVTYPIAKAVSPIPPTVYLPYTIVLLPTFASASVFLIFIGAFWPILVGTVYGVFSVDRRLINSARTLGLSEGTMIRKVLFPAALSSIYSGAFIALIMSFITLTVAEMIAATSGLGWYIEYHHQFANYDRVLAGIILIAAVVIVLMYFFDRIQKRSLSWQESG